MTRASLFTGIGCFDLAAELVGWQNVFQVEKNWFCLEQLQRNFSHTEKHKEIEKFDGKKYRHAIDVISGYYRFN